MADLADPERGTSPTLGDYEIRTGRDGRRRLFITGRSGFPIQMLEGETPEQAHIRYEAKVAAKAAAQAAAPPPPPGQIPDDIAARIPPPGDDSADPPPRQAKRPGVLKGPSTAELAKVLEELLVLPAIPMGMPVYDPHFHIEGQPGVGTQQLVEGEGIRPRCLYCRDHFLTEGPQAAQEMAKLSEHNEPLRRVLVQLHTWWGMITLSSVLGGYAMKPLLHHVAPEPMLNTMGAIIGVPGRMPMNPMKAHDHASPPPPPGTDPAAAAAGPGPGPA